MSIDANQGAPVGDRVQDGDQPLHDLAIEERQDFVIENGVVRLIVSRSQSSGSVAFPKRSICQVTGARDLVADAVGPAGILYTHSTVHISSTRATPYTLGYVDFPNGLRVLAEVRADGADTLTCDMPVTLASDGAQWWVVPAKEGATA